MRFLNPEQMKQGEKVFRLLWYPHLQHDCKASSFGAFMSMQEGSIGTVPTELYEVYSDAIQCG